MSIKTSNARPQKQDKSTAYEVRPEQSVDLLKALHILTPDGKLNQDSRRKLKQVYHLFHFIEPLLENLRTTQNRLCIVDHWAGKSYLGFILYDLFFKPHALSPEEGHIFSIETRQTLVEHAQALAEKAHFTGMSFLNLSVADSITDPALPGRVDMVTALHACNTATDDAIRFALAKQAEHIVLVPCCQAEVAAVLKQNKAQQMKNPLSEIWRHPIHTREFGSQLTNALRCLQLEAHGYQVSVTELVGWEHSLKNELIIASRRPGHPPTQHHAERLKALLTTLGLNELEARFFTPHAPLC